MTKRFRHWEPAYEGQRRPPPPEEIGDLTQLVDHMRRHRLVQTRRAGVVKYSCGALDVKQALVNTAIAAELIVVRDEGLFDGSGFAQSFEVNKKYSVRGVRLAETRS